MAFKIAFFDTKPYDRASFDEVNVNSLKKRIFFAFQ